MDQSIMQCSIFNPQDPHGPPKHFSFDGVYFVDSTTESIYNDIAYPLVEVSHLPVEYYNTPFICPRQAIPPTIFFL
jgi:hypothetical protein